jgi:hypothetical protein
MASKIKNIIIFTIIAASLILIYIFFIKKGPEEANLISSPGADTMLADTNTLDQNSLIAKDFLSVLLSVKSIKLDDTIFSNIAFTSLHDSSIILTPPSVGEEGRLNPFAPIGFETATTPVAPVAPVPTPPASSTPSKTTPNKTP